MSKRDRGALGTLQPAQVEINTNNMTLRNRLREAQSDRPGATAAIELHNAKRQPFGGGNFQCPLQNEQAKRHEHAERYQGCAANGNPGQQQQPAKDFKPRKRRGKKEAWTALA